MSRRGGPGTVVFDLDPDDGGELPPAGPGGLPEPAGEVPPGLLARGYRRVSDALARQPRRRLVRWAAALAAGAVGVAGTVAVVGAVRGAAAERERVAAVLASPGGVLDLSAPLVEAWSQPLTGAPLGALPGTVVVAEGGDVVGLSVTGTDDGAVAAGGELWRHDLGGELTCAPGWYQRQRGPTPTQLVCLAGPQEARRVAVIEADGEVRAGADLGDTTDLQVWPGPAGSVVRVSRTGPVPDLPVITRELIDAGEVGGLTEGQDAVVEVTDALTGDTRWQAVVPFVGQEHLDWCGFDETTSNGTAAYELHLGAEVQVGRGFVQVTGCGLTTASFTIDGKELLLEDLRDGSGWVDTLPTEGYYAVTTHEPTQVEPDLRVFDEAGELLFETTGSVLFPPVADAPYPQTLVSPLMGGDLRALDRSGDELWTAGLSVGGGFGPGANLLGLVDGQAIFASAKKITAISLEDGTTVWTKESDALKGLGDWRGINGAVTDQRTLVLDVRGWPWSDESTPELQKPHLIGIDVTTGETWDVAREGENSLLLTVDGSLLEYVGSSESTATELPNGELGMEVQGRLSLLVPGEGEEGSRATP